MKLITAKKRPIIINAIQWDGTAKCYQFITDIFNDIPHIYEDIDGIKEFQIYTLEGNHFVSINDYIIKGINGEYYPCKPDIFLKTYEIIG